MTDPSLRALVTTLKSLGDLEKDGCTVALPESRASSERVEAGGGPKVSLSSFSGDDDCVLPLPLGSAECSQVCRNPVCLIALVRLETLGWASEGQGTATCSCVRGSPPSRSRSVPSSGSSSFESLVFKFSDRRVAPGHSLVL